MLRELDSRPADAGNITIRKLVDLTVLPPDIIIDYRDKRTGEAYSFTVREGDDHNEAFAHPNAFKDAYDRQDERKRMADEARREIETLTVLSPTAEPAVN